MANLWTASFLSKFLNGSNWRIQLFEEGFELNKLIIKWSEIESATLKKGFIWNKIIVKLREKEIQIEGLPKKLSRILIICFENMGRLQKTIHLLSIRFEKEIYLRNVEFLEIQSITPNKEKLFQLFNSKEVNADILIAKNNQNLLLNIANGDRSDIQNWNSAFIKNEMFKYASYFKSLETEPLTDEQIKSSIIMEDNNLLIAAAGSGKTSVIISKLGYLIQKNYAKPEDILVLSFNNKVKDEINLRINRSLKNVLKDKMCPIVHTFHSYGYSVIKDGNLNKRTPAWMSSEAKTLSHLKSIFYKVIKENNAIAAEIALFIIWDGIDNKDENEISNLFHITETSSIEQLSKLTLKDINPESISNHKTLLGKYVRSVQELKISNWLILFGIENKYEKNIPINGLDDYRPDFYYSKINCLHEHFGINKFGKAPTYFFKNGKMSYEDTVKLKRASLKKAKVKWFETTSEDFYNDTWHIKLDAYLREFGEKPNFIGWDKYQKIVGEFNKENDGTDFLETPFITLLLSSIKHFKNNQFTFEDIDKKISKLERKYRYQSFFKIFKAIFEEYEKSLAEDDCIDFEDMLNLSTALLNENKVRHSFKFILVDEFQDMSNSRAGLIQALKQQDQKTILFGVGDDWQSIYRFAGSDASNMINFEQKFGFSSINKLSKTFRFNQGIADISSEFILKNDLQILKEVTANSSARKNKLRYIGHEKIKQKKVLIEGKFVFKKDSKDFDRLLLSQLEIIKSYAVNKNTKVSVALLGRYHYSKPDNLDVLIYKYQDWLDISFSSIHSSKGLGWDFVVILGIDGSFPSTKIDDDVLSLFMSQPDKYPFAEERRLFYVALTRAKIAAILLGDKDNHSLFLDELENTKYQDVISMNNT